MKDKTIILIYINGFSTKSYLGTSVMDASPFFRGEIWIFSNLTNGRTTNMEWITS